VHIHAKNNVPAELALSCGALPQQSALVRLRGCGRNRE